MINIIKGGLKNVVDEIQFERLYKPNGWRIDTTMVEDEGENKIPLDILKTETEVKDYIKMTKNQSKRFDDKLFYSELENDERS